MVVEPRRRVVEKPVLFPGLFRPSRASLLPARRSHARRRLESARPMVVGRARLVEGCGTSQALTRNPDAALASELSNVPSVLARHVRSSQAPRRTSPFKAGPTPLEHQLSSPCFQGEWWGRPTNFQSCFRRFRRFAGTLFLGHLSGVPFRARRSLSRTPRSCRGRVVLTFAADWIVLP